MITTGRIPYPEAPKNLGHGLELADPEKLKTSETKRDGGRLKSYSAGTA